MKKSSILLKAISVLMCITIMVMFVPKMDITVFAADKGTQSCSNSATDGPTKVTMNLNNASYVSGNTAVYVVDKYYYEDMASFGNTYSVTFELNGMMVSTDISSDGYSISNTAHRSDQILNASNNVYITDTSSGSFVGDIPAAGSSQEFTMTASISNTYKYNKYYLTSSAKTSLNVKIIGVDTTELQELIIANSGLRSSCWTSATWSTFNSAFTNAKSVAESATVTQSDINAAVTSLKNARSALVHNGPVSGCQYCLGGGSGDTSINVNSYLNLSYANNGERSLYDLYLPANTQGDISMILYIHGGAWSFGSKENMTGEAYNACKNYGLATAAISYRYASLEVNGFDILNDVQAAVSAIKAEAASHGLNIQKMMVYGFSAGAHLSLMYGYTRADVSAIKPVCVFSKSGPAYLYNEKYMEESSQMPMLLSCVCGQYFTEETRSSAYVALMKMSPAYYVNSKSVPTVVCHGMQDSIVPFTDSIVLNQALDNYNIEHTYITFPNSNHGLESDADKSVEMQAAFENYVNKYLLDVTPTVVHRYTAAITPATCSSEGYTTYTCKDCGKYYVSDFVYASHKAGEEVKENIVAATCSKEGSYDAVSYCTVCGLEISRTQRTTSKASHTAGDWEVLTPATCDAEGLMARRCTVCGEVIEQEVVSMLPHTEVIDAAVVATCTEKGKTQGKHCSVCNTVIEPQKETDALGHDMVVTKEGYEETCTEKGLSDEKKCSRCDVVEEQTEIPATGHTIVTEYGREATCTEDGLSDRVFCQVCGYVEKEQEVIESFGGHKDLDNDGFCDRCGTEVEKPQTGNTCDHLCHKDGIVGWLWKNILCPIIKFLGIEQKCKCGVDHWTK